jgi:tetratricopeptide (TPR) repeat protein
MRCSHCGGETTFAGGRCTACGVALSPLPVAVAGVLTPLPDAWLDVRPGSEGETVLSDVPTRRLSPRDATLPRPEGATPLALGQAFANRYHIIRILGEGGMGCVFHAWDAELGIAVAIKVIRLEISNDLEIERRFKRELLLARQVSHKNVVRIHDLGDIDGMKYITMSYVEGADLATILRRYGKLPVPRVLHLARQIAAGLQAAHEVGVVHRDLKPANIMVDASDHAQIMDFGIARSTGGDSGAGTVAGTVVGTIEYMAPEQAQATSADQRADIYSFGLILYDLLLGRRPVPAGESVVAELVARMNSAPPTARSLDPAIPEPLDAIINKCLQPDRADRYQTTNDLVASLARLDENGHLRPEVHPRLPKSWAAAASLLVLLLVGGTWWFARGESPPPAARDPVSVLIADFENRSGDPVFDGALEQALTVAMEGASFVTSFQRSQAQTLIGQLGPGRKLDEEGARLISQREGIKVVLAGAIAREGSGYAIEVKAIDAIPNKALLTARAEADNKAEVLDAVGRVAAQIREALGDTTTESGRIAANETFTTTSFEAAREYAQGQELFQQVKYEDAIQHYQKAIAKDPEFGRAYSSWAISAMHLGRTQESEELFKQALARLDRMSEREKLRTLGVYYSRIAQNPGKAIETYTDLVEKYPADSIALNNLAVAHFNTLNFRKALEFGRKQLDLFPESVLGRFNYALYAMYAGDFSSARIHAETTLKRNPDTPLAYLALAIADVSVGHLEEASATYERAAKTSARGASLAAIGLADLRMYQGRFEEAASLLAPAIAADRAAKNIKGTSTKLVALAAAEQAQGRTAAALREMGEALKISQSEAVAVPAANLYLQAGRTRDAQALAARFGRQLVPRARAYGKLIEGMTLVSGKQPVEAVQSLREALELADLWLVRYWLGVAYVEAGAYAEALSELEACEKRRGEASAVFLDDVPSWRHTVPVKYWLARAQEGVGVKAQAAANYKAFLALRPTSDRDPLVLDARKRAGA